MSLTICHFLLCVFFHPECISWNQLKSMHAHLSSHCIGALTFNIESIASQKVLESATTKPDRSLHF